MNYKAVEYKSLRLDKWLWFARFCKTRVFAQQLIESGQVAINGKKVRKVSAHIRRGDGIEMVLGSVKRIIIVRGMSKRRGPASEACLLYDESTPVEKLVGLDKGLPLYKPQLWRPSGAGRPTKKERRRIMKQINNNKS